MEYRITSGKGEKAKQISLSLGASASVGELKKAFAKATKKDINRCIAMRGVIRSVLHCCAVPALRSAVQCSAALRRSDRSDYFLEHLNTK
jgi:hypothetical protein